MEVRRDFMLNEQDFLKEEKRCAQLLGMTLEEYRKYKSKVKVPTQNKKEQNEKKDNSILKKLGLEIRDLKSRKVACKSKV